MKRRSFISLSMVGAYGGLVQNAESRKRIQSSPTPTSVGFQKKQSSAGSSNPNVSWNRRVPVRYEADVAVIGGGIAGVSAACAAARSAANVILVERFAVAGGNSTSGGVASFCGETAGQGEVFDEIVADLQRFDAIAPYRPFPETDHRVFDHEILAFVLQELLLRRTVKLLLHTRFVDVCEREGRITECIVCGKSGPEALRAKQFIDCTGEADVTRFAGFETVAGRPQDGLRLPMSMMFFVRHVDPAERRKQLPEGWLNPIRSSQDLPMTSVWPNGPRSNALKVKIPLFNSTNTESLTAAEIQGRRRMLEVLDFYQRVRKEPWLLDHCSPQIGIREGCRIVGDYTLTLDDVRAGRSFEDGVARGVYYLDAHKPDDDKRSYVLKNQVDPPDAGKRWYEGLEVPPYQIPLRSLIVKQAKNLMAAGRCFSADQLALSSARVTTSCSMMGQAAGIAAALSVEKGCDPRDLNAKEVRRIVTARKAALSV